MTNLIKKAARLLLGAALIYAGTGHLSFSRSEFQAQVPSWVPLDPDFVVLASGFVEIGLGVTLILSLFVSLIAPAVGVLTALFFIAIFPGNIAQFVTGTSAFGLDTDQARLIRLFFQPLLVLWALWSTGGFNWLRGLWVTRQSK
jgi:uncharacterized membrane protein